MLNMVMLQIFVYNLMIIWIIFIVKREIFLLIILSWNQKIMVF